MQSWPQLSRVAQQISSRVQRDKEAIDDWLCDLRSISSKCEFGTDCCAACEPTRILGQLVFGVRSDDDRRKLLEIGPTLKLDDALNTLRLTEATRKQSANLKGSDASSISRISQSTYKKNKNSNQQKSRPSIRKRIQFRLLPSTAAH